MTRAVALTDAERRERNAAYQRSFRARQREVAAWGDIPCQLATDGGDRPLNGKRLIEYKADGMRGLAVLDRETGRATLYSRSGNPITSFPHISRALTRLMRHMAGSVVLDGEITGLSFERLLEQHSLLGEDVSDVRFQAFDIIGLEAFRAGHWAVSQAERSAILGHLAASGLLDGTPISVTPGEVVDLDTAAGQARLEEMRLEASQAGAEGLVAKLLSAPYSGGKNAAWAKLKPVQSYDLTVVGWKAGKGKLRGQIGSLICQGEDGGQMIRACVGVGLSEVLRSSDPAAWMGLVIEVEADGVTRNRTGASLRFPRFVRCRGWMAGQKD